MRLIRIRFRIFEMALVRVRSVVVLRVLIFLCSHTIVSFSTQGF